MSLRSFRFQTLCKSCIKRAQTANLNAQAANLNNFNLDAHTVKYKIICENEKQKPMASEALGFSACKVFWGEGFGCKELRDLFARPIRF